MSDQLKKLIREVPDFPKPGIVFYDITTLLKDPAGLQAAVEGMTDLVADCRVDKVVGIESRGFIFATDLARKFGAGFVPVRKPGKLPAATTTRSYALEYGSDALEIHSDGIEEGESVLIVDDLLATGGTAKATTELVTDLGGEIAAILVLIELRDLNGRQALDGQRVESLLKY